MKTAQGADECTQALQKFHTDYAPNAYRYLGVHEENGRTVFRVWAPHATAAWVCGELGEWGAGTVAMSRVTEGGVWEAWVSSDTVPEGSVYRYRIQNGQKELYRTDPYGYALHAPYLTASVVVTGILDRYAWRDKGWLAYRRGHFAKGRAASQPINIYSLHLASWMRNEEQGKPLSYEALARELSSYVKQMGYTHISLLSVAEYVFDPSQGSLTCGYFAPTARHGSPIDLMRFVDSMHEAGIGVLFEWTAAGFSKNAIDLARFDGDFLYESGDDCDNDFNFDLTRPEVRSFLLSNAVYWIEQYHADGLWIHGAEDGFFDEINAYLAKHYPDVITVLSTRGGADAGSFSFVQNAARMEAPLSYLQTDPLWRKYDHKKMVASFAVNESACEVVGITHRDVSDGKGSLINRMHGDYLQQFAGARLFLAYLMTLPQKKLLFMGSELGEFDEWRKDRQIQWFLTEFEQHALMQQYCAELGHFYLSHPALWERDGKSDGFAWIDADNADLSIFSYRRCATDGSALTVLLNFTPVERQDFLLSVPSEGIYDEVFNSDLKKYGGSTHPPPRAAEAFHTADHGARHAIRVTVPPLSAIIYQKREDA